MRPPRNHLLLADATDAIGPSDAGPSDGGGPAQTPRDARQLQKLNRRSVGQSAQPHRVDLATGQQPTVEEVTDAHPDLRAPHAPTGARALVLSRGTPRADALIPLAYFRSVCVTVCPAALFTVTDAGADCTWVE
jgi:hypothetical protein